MIIEKFITIKRASQDRLPREIFDEATRSIGGAIDATTGDVLKGLSFAEEQILLPSLVNTPANSTHFIQACRKFWQDIDIIVPIDGTKLNVTTYGAKVDFKTIVNEVQSQKQERFDTFDVDSEEGIAEEKNDSTKVESDNNFDMPVNVMDYVKYRYALKHNQVANNKLEAESQGIPFYLEDKVVEDNKEFEKLNLTAKARKSIDKFLPKMEDLSDTKANNFRALYAIGVLTKGHHSHKIENETKTILKTIWALCEEIPEKVIEHADDRTLMDKFLIDSLLNYQVIESIENKIYDKVIGTDPVSSNIDEYIKFINLPANKDVLARLKATLNKKMRN